MNKRSALLVIDVQMAMFSYDNFRPYREEELLENIYSLINSARNNQVPVIYIQHTSEEDSPYNRERATWHIHPMIAPKAGEVVVEKRECDAFHETLLHEILQRQGITELIIMGMQTDYCVDTTCRRAFSLGYSITLVSDAHSTFDNEVLKAEQIVRHHNQILSHGFAGVKTTEEIEL